MTEPAFAREHLASTLDDARERRLWDGVEVRARRRREMRRLRTTLASSAVLAALAGLAGWSVGSSEPGALRLANGEPVGSTATTDEAATMTLDDGSSLGLAAETEVLLRANDGHRFEIEMVSGEASFSVTPGGPRRWRIHTPLGTVTVVGTVFRVSATARWLAVEVEHGRVEVASELLEGGVRVLGAGESVSLRLPEPSRPEPSAAAARDPEPSATPVEDDARAVVSPPASEPARSRRRDADWRLAADEGRYEDAYALAAPEHDRLVRLATADELLALADAARLSGHPHEAVEPLERLLERFPRSPEAGLGAMTLARLELGVLSHTARGLAALERARELPLPAALRDEADARRALALAALGRDAEARAAAEGYVTAHPAGRFRDDVVALTGE